MSDGKTLRLTPNHPVLTGNENWVEAKNLKEQIDSIMSVNTNANKSLYRNYIEKIELIQDKIIVYNFATTEHTYIANGLVVHNCFEDKDSQRMTFDTAKDILNFVHKAPGNFHGFTFFGGEPMLEFDSIVVPLVEYSKTLWNPTYFAMTTNGTLLDKEKIDWLFENNVNFMFSVDGNKETQDSNRPMKNGNSSFDALEQNLLYVLKKRPNHSKIFYTLRKLEFIT